LALEIEAFDKFPIEPTPILTETPTPTVAPEITVVILRIQAGIKTT
jgi:hypothetical protein